LGGFKEAASTFLLRIIAGAFTTQGTRRQFSFWGALKGLLLVSSSSKLTGLKFQEQRGSLLFGGL
jgi:hypothetical protein